MAPIQGSNFTTRSLPAILEEDKSTSAPRKVHSLPIVSTQRINDDEITNTLLEGTSADTASWRTILSVDSRSYASDECAVEDAEFVTPSSSEKLQFSRSPPRITRSLSLISLMVAGVKELAKRPMKAATFREAGFGDGNDYEADEGLEIVIPRRAKSPRTDPEAARPDAQTAKSNNEPKTTGQRKAAEEENKSFWEDFLEHDGGYNGKGW
ncbi:hypothetical protein F4802DRAFT_603074 [Xylaria palmicola]|nr:hypothetical protein F4802DRAFT_603074 [Xylaria palmicola]